MTWLLRARDPEGRFGVVIAGCGQRQLHVLGVQGAGTARTGSARADWCGHALFDGYGAAGNLRSGPQPGAPG